MQLKPFLRLNAYNHFDSMFLKFLEKQYQQSVVWHSPDPRESVVIFPE